MPYHNQRESTLFHILKSPAEHHSFRPTEHLRGIRPAARTSKCHCRPCTPSRTRPVACAGGARKLPSTMSAAAPRCSAGHRRPRRNRRVRRSAVDEHPTCRPRTVSANSISAKHCTTSVLDPASAGFSIILCVSESVLRLEKCSIACTE